MLNVDLKLSPKVLLVIGLVLASVMGTIMYYTLYLDIKQSIQQATRMATTINKVIFASLNYVMKSGFAHRINEQVNVELCNLENQSKIENIDEIRIIQGGPAARQFGVREERRPRSEEERRALRGEIIMKTENRAGHRVMRAIFPLRSREECLGCHKVKVGEVLGVVSTSISLADVDRAIKTKRAILAVLFGVGLSLTAVVLFCLLRKIVIKPIGRLTDVTKKIAKEGDLTQRIKFTSNDEVGQLADAFREMQANLAALAKGIKEAGLKISSLSSEILATSKQQSDGAAEQAAAVEEVGATIEELSSTAGQIANNTNDVVTAAEKTLKSAESGQAAIAETTDSMEDIRSKTLTSSQKIMALGEKSQQIGSVLELINEIVAETKMLSLNASIEASKAGEAGKGFSVVAAEIRKLAEKATNSTATIEAIITEIQSSVNETIMGTEENVKRAEAQAQLVKKVGASLEEILPLAEATVEVARQISAATHQQKAGSEQVAASVKEISDVSKQTAASSREATASAEELDSLAEQLKEAVSSFKFNGHEPQLTAKETKDY